MTVPVSPGDAEDLSTETAQAYAEAELSILGRLAAFIGLNLDSDLWSTERRDEAGLVRRALVGLMGRLFTKGRKAALKAVKEAERRGVALADQELGDLAPDAAPPGPLAENVGKALADDLKRVERSMLKHTMTVYQRVITEVTLAVEAGTATRLQAAERALARFADAGIVGFVDKAGRNWEIATYVEMATRTHAANVMVDAHLARLASAGVRLVQVSEAPYECKLCKPWEGKVLEAGGASGPHTVKVRFGGATHTVRVDGSLEEARAAGLFHPNCRHNVTGYLPGASRAAEKADTKGVRYEHTQQQRALERAARRWDRRRAVARTDNERKKADAKFKAYRARIREHTARTGLPRKTNRERHDATR